MNTRKRLLASAVSLLAVIGMVSACTPPDSSGGLPKKDWKFQGTQVRVLDSQDCTNIGTDWLPIWVNCEDEPYMINIAFRVKIGKKNSAQAWVASPRSGTSDSNIPQNIKSVTGGGGPVDTLTGPWALTGAPVTFTALKPVDAGDLLNSSNKLEIFGTYTWAVEEDATLLGSVNADANLVATLLQTGLNETLAKSNLTDLDADAIVQKVLAGLLNNLDGAFALGFHNVTDWLGDLLPWGDTNDDVLGGGLYVGIAAHGTLGNAINGVLGGMTMPTLNLGDLLGINVTIPPNIDQIGLYTMNGPKTFVHAFSGQDGVHEWTMASGPA